MGLIWPAGHQLTNTALILGVRLNITANTNMKSNSLVIKTRLRSEPTRRPSHQTGPVPRLLAEEDSVGLVQAVVAVARQQLILPLHDRRDHVEEDDPGAHGLPEYVLGPGRDAEGNK